MSEAAPRISVVIPVFNGERYIGETIASVLRQTVADFEVVVSDNASTDRTPSIVEGLADGRFRLLRNDVDLGAVPNWNRGMAEASGRYVKVLCSDDVLYPDCLEREAAVLDDPANASVSLVTAVHDVIDENGRRIMSRGLKRGGRMAGCDAIRRMARTGTNLVGEPSGTMFRAAAYAAAGPWAEEARYVMDVDMWMRLLLEGDLYVIDSALSAFRVQRGSWSHALRDWQTSDYRDMLERFSHDPRFGLTAADVALGSLGAWRNAHLRRIFYRLFLSGPGTTPAEGRSS